MLVALALHKPKGYQYAEKVTENQQVSEYLTHYLAPHVHNNIQFDVPFRVIVPQDGINEIIAEDNLFGLEWPVELSIASFSTPSAYFMPNAIYLMGTVEVLGLDILVMICANPILDEEGLLRLNIEYVRAGALDISLLAKGLAEKFIADELEDQDNYWLKDIEGAICENKPFEPVFPTIYDREIRLIESNISEGELVLVFEPEKQDNNRH